MKILLAVDGSPYTKKMLAYLAVHDQLLSPDSQYTALTIRTALPARARAALGKEIVDSTTPTRRTRCCSPWPSSWSARRSR